METTPSPKTLRPQTYSKAMQVYLVVFDSFAATKSAVASALGLTKGQATGALKTLEEAGLVVQDDVNETAQGSMRRGQYGELVWQCYETYDYISRDEAIELFKSKFTTTEQSGDAMSAQSAPEAPVAEEITQEATQEATQEQPKPRGRGKKSADSPKAGRKPASEKKASTTKPAAGPRKVHLTNSQRKALLKLKDAPVQIEGLSALAVQPYEYFVAEELATKTAKQYKITAKGKERAADIDPAKYGG